MILYCVSAGITNCIVYVGTLCHATPSCAFMVGFSLMCWWCDRVCINSINVLLVYSWFNWHTCIHCDELVVQSLFTLGLALRIS